MPSRRRFSMPDAIEFYADLLHEGDLAFDIGANIGVHTDAMLHAGARVVAFEPQTSLAHGLAQRFKGEPRLTVLSCAVADTVGSVVLVTASKAPHLATANASWRVNSREPEGTWDGEQVRPAITLASAIERFGMPDFLKIDTEGYDHLVLATLEAAPRRVMFEVHDRLPALADACFERLDGLAEYDYWLMREESWEFEPDWPLLPHEITVGLPTWGDVYAERIQ